MAAAWSRAVAGLHAAEAECDAALVAPVDHARLDRADAAADRAFDAMLAAPVPHLAALADKAELLAADHLWEMAGAPACLAALAADARRLACDQAAPQGTHGTGFEASAA